MQVRKLGPICKGGCADTFVSSFRSSQGLNMSRIRSSFAQFNASTPSISILEVSISEPAPSPGMT